ncbi:Metal-dependent hydrolase, endonuclease/exonuclease/phosphatase family [Halopseudomonas litoralis]|uniref:Metal-dependent hydrolase, endonuclease/exonuclease/phosphatase family n=1 Tax=Halopseudomonas litoralis TaxID=797277 RepID=A0A1H1T9F5_9GAMM|nr:endonuclease/exonuclease/phosphatase family protein [Halopseudomonas litoralis]SDS56249.1 Metal-dependent hydrolase, endonuclease/exonuclease/phosphatase family [Halopseudomonas litoralis]
MTPLSSTQEHLTNQAPPVHSIRVLTVNTHKGFSWLNRRFILPELREAVRTQSSDLVFLQEVLGVHERHGQAIDNWPEAPHYEFLADTMWPEFAYGRNAVYPDGHHGNALLSKFPILHYENLDVSISGTEERGLLHAILDVPGQADLHAICVHLGLRERHRRRQLRLLCRLLDRLPPDDPVIIAGDFNDWLQRAGPRLSRCGLKEAFVTANGSPAKSFPAQWPLLCLDRIYVRNLTTHGPETLIRRPWSHLSDHAPLSVEVRF